MRIPGCHVCCCYASGIRTIFHLPVAPRFFFSLPRFHTSPLGLSHLQYKSLEDRAFYLLWRDECYGLKSVPATNR